MGGDEVDRLLAAPLLRPPPDFTDRVMRRVGRESPPEPGSRLRSTLQWLAMLGAGIPAAIQVLVFLSGMWTATAAG